MTDEVASVPPGNTGGSMYAVDVAPERRRVVKLTGEPGSYQEEIVSDYKTLSKISDEVRQMADVLVGVKQVGKPKDEMADSDDTDAEQSYLMQAWQSLVMYVATCDDDDRAAAMQALKMVTNLMSDAAEPNQPATTGAFNATSMARRDIAANTFDCPQCKRDFSTEAGLISHLKTVHAQREKETTMKTETD